MTIGKDLAGSLCLNLFLQPALEKSELLSLWNLQGKLPQELQHNGRLLGCNLPAVLFGDDQRGHFTGTKGGVGMGFLLEKSHRAQKGPWSQIQPFFSSNNQDLSIEKEVRRHSRIAGGE